MLQKKLLMSMITKKQTWGIIGGGILGMTLAYRLKQQGHEVTLFEAAKEIGGLTAAWELNDFVWDKFYHVILLSDSNLRELLKEIDLEKEINWVETKTGFYTDEKLYSMSNLIEFLSFPPIRLIDKIRLGITIYYASKVKNWKRLEKIPVEKWLKQWSGKRTFNKIWLPLLKAKLGENYKFTSASFIWTTIQRMYSARRKGLKKEMFGYVPGGYSRVLKKYYETLNKEGINIKTGYSAKKVYQSDSKAIIEFTNGEADNFDNVILTIPSTVIEEICPGLSETEKQKLKNVKYLGVVCVSVVLKKALDKYYVTNITDSSPFTGVIEMSALVDKKEFKGKNLVYLPKYVTPDAPIYQKSDEEINKEFIEALIRMYPHINEDDIIYCKVARAKYVFALSTINYSESLPPVKTSLPGVYIVNSSHIVNGTLNVNETLDLVKKKLPEITQFPLTKQ
jgi:protoporphyrinogen oxidase